MTKTTANTMTQAAALRWLIDNAVNAPEDVITAAEKLYTAKTKKYDRTRTVSKERMINENLVGSVVDLIKSAPEGEMINATWINANFSDANVRSPQKARVIAEIAIEQGLLEKYTEKGRTYYRVVD